MASAANGEDRSHLAEPALLANRSADPWDASRQVLLSLAYQGGHPHDKPLLAKNLKS
jgi:hypothetical protein